MSRGVKSLDNAISIINLISKHEELGVSEISKQIGMSKSSVYNILFTLNKHNWVMKSKITEKYKLGLRLFELGYTVRANMQLRAIAIPYMEKIITRTKEVAYLTVYNAGQVVYIETAHPKNLVTISSVIGRSVHLHCTGVGKAIMAFLPDEEVKNIIELYGMPAFTPNTITSAEELQKELVNIRNTGYAIDNMEHEYGVKCVAAPIFNDSGQAIASMSLSGPSLRFDNKTEEYAQMIKEVTLEISRKFGWTGKMIHNGLTSQV